MRKSTAYSPKPPKRSIGDRAALNSRVYAFFALADAEITLIEAATKYHTGEV